MPGLLTAIKGVISGKGPELIKELGNGLDEIFTSKEERFILENKKLEIEALLKEKVMNHDEKIQELALEETKSYLIDTQDARNNNTKIQEFDNASWLSKNVLYILALFVTLGFFGLIGYLCTHKVPQENKDILNIMLGSLGTAWITIIAFFFGSSVGSKNNGDIVRKIAENK